MGHNNSYSNTLQQAITLCNSHNIQTIDLSNNNLFINYNHAYGNEINVTSITFKNGKFYLDGIDPCLEEDLLEDGETNTFEDIDLIEDCLVEDGLRLLQVIIGLI